MSPTVATPEQNKAALDYFVQLPVSKEMIAYLARKACQVINCEQPQAQPALQLNKHLPPTPPATPPQAPPQLFAREPALPSVEAFITSIVERSHVQVPTLMSSLVYLARLKSRLPPVAKGMRCTVHRIFLASLILAAKNLNDSSPKNKHWARYSTVRGFDSFGFSITEVNLMEKQLLFLLDWDLRITPEDLYIHLDPFLAPVRDYHVAQAEKARQIELRRLERELQARQEAGLAHSAISYRTTSSQAYSSYLIDDAHYMSHSRAPSRTPSLSPPIRGGYAASSSEDDSMSDGSPISNPDSYVDHEPLQLHRYDDIETGDSSIVHIRRPDSSLQKMRLPPLESFENQKPAKKAKTSGSIFARLITQAGAIARSHAY